MEQWEQTGYYERLGIDRHADPSQIKRAYFGLVRQYPPERFPDAFKAVREAYDILSNPEARAAYDQRASVPADIQSAFQLAMEARRQGRFRAAAEYLERLLAQYPEHPLLREEMATAYEDIEKNGKAMKLWEGLARQFPENAFYALSLGESYEHRGWVRKAQEEYERAVEADRHNLDAWNHLIRFLATENIRHLAMERSAEALAVAREKGVVDPVISSFAFQYYLQKDDDEACTQLLEEVLSAVDQGRIGGSDLDVLLYALLCGVMIHQRIQYFPVIQTLAGRVLNPDPELAELLEEGAALFQIHQLAEQGYPQLFQDLMEILLIPEHERDEEDLADRLAMELHILMDMDTYRPYLLRLKEEAPALYSLHAAFFNEALRTRDRAKLIHKRYRDLSKSGYLPNFDGPDLEGVQEDDELPPPVQTVRRDSPKVGRNDPCPCGSGKKYKKCCGA